MKKSFLFIIVIGMSICVMGQEKTKQKEVGLVFRNLDSFGLTYRTGTNKSLWRFNTLLIKGFNQTYKADSSEKSYKNNGFGISIGKEFRKSFADNLELRFGADLAFKYSYTEQDKDDLSVDDNDRYSKTTTYSPGIDLVFGLNYVINDHLVIGAELLPSFTYNIGSAVRKNAYSYTEEEIESDISGFSYGLSNSSAMLSVAYRF